MTSPSAADGQLQQYNEQHWTRHSNSSSVAPDLTLMAPTLASNATSSLTTSNTSATVRLPTDADLPIPEGARSPFPLAAFTSRSLLTGEGLPPCDQAIVKRCRNRAAFRAVAGATLVGGGLGALLYGRGLMTAPRRFILTSIVTLWGATAGAFSSSPSCLKSIKDCQDPSSLLKRELTRIVIVHNPNLYPEAAKKYKEKNEQAAAAATAAATIS